MNTEKKWNKCPRKIKYDKEQKIFILIYECNSNLPHDTYIFELFNHKFKTNKLEIFNMISKKYQKYYVRVFLKIIWLTIQTILNQFLKINLISI